MILINCMLTLWNAFPRCYNSFPHHCSMINYMKNLSNKGCLSQILMWPCIYYGFSHFGILLGIHSPCVIRAMLFCLILWLISLKIGIFKNSRVMPFNVTLKFKLLEIKLKKIHSFVHIWVVATTLDSPDK